MTINKSRDNNSLVVAIEGRLDTATAPQLEADLRESLENETSLVFDLKDLEYISSAGLRVLLSAQKAMNTKGEMKIRNANEIVMEVFEVTGFTDILTIE